MKVPLKNFPFQRFGLTYCELSHWKFKPNWNANELAIIFYGRIGMFKHTVFRLKGLIQFSGRLPKWKLSEFHRFIVNDDGDYYYYYQHYSDEFKKIGAFWLVRVRLKAICAVHWKSWFLPVERIKDHLLFVATMLHYYYYPILLFVLCAFSLSNLEKKEKSTEKTIQFVFICTFTFHTLLRNFDGFSWSPSKLCYFRSGSVGICAYFSVTFSLLVCFSSTSSYVVCSRESWENPNTSRTNREIKRKRGDRGQWRFVTQTIVQILCIEMHLSWFMCVCVRPPFEFPYAARFLTLFFPLFQLSPSRFVCSFALFLLVFVCYSFESILFGPSPLNWWWHGMACTPPQPHFRCHKFSISINCLIHKNNQKHTRDAYACVSNLLCCPTITFFSLVCSCVRVCLIYALAFILYIKMVKVQ